MDLFPSIIIIAEELLVKDLWLMQFVLKPPYSASNQKKNISFIRYFQMLGQFYTEHTNNFNNHTVLI